MLESFVCVSSAATTRPLTACIPGFKQHCIANEASRCSRLRIWPVISGDPRNEALTQKKKKENLWD